MPRLLFLILLLVGASTIYAQQDPQYSQYMYNTMTINPGYAGSEDAISAALLHREEMVGMPGRPSVSVFHVNSPIKLFNANHGIGLSVINENIAFNKNIGGNFSYAFRLPIQNIGKLGIGISGGFQNKALDAEWNAGEGSTTNDNAIPQPKESGMSYDLAFGIFYKAENLYLGVSATHLTEPKIKYQTSSFTLKRHYYLTAGYNIVLPNPAFEFQPSVLIATDAVTSKLDISSTIVYNKKLWGGVSYRLGVAFVGMAGIQLFNGIRIGYSYDYATSALNKISSGTHELMVSYSFTLSRERIPHKYKSVRFL